MEYGKTNESTKYESTPVSNVLSTVAIPVQISTNVLAKQITARQYNRYSILNSREAMEKYEQYRKNTEDRNEKKHQKYKQYDKKNTNERYKNMNKKKLERWDIYLQNVNGMRTKYATKALTQIKSHVKENKTIMINIVETWFNQYTGKAGDIDHYNVHRADRKGRVKGGGAAIYINNALESKMIKEISIKKCELVAVEIPEINTVNIVIYRPPKTRKAIFDTILDEVEDIIGNMSNPKPTILISGDFNFPFIKWENCEEELCVAKASVKTKSNARKDEKLQFERLNNICEEQGMVQTISQATRENNTLELMYTNEISMVTDIDINKSAVSDHKRIVIGTTYKIKGEIEENNKRKEEGMRAINLRSKKVDWREINNELKIRLKNWNEECREENAIETTEKFILILENVCKENAPKKSRTKEEEKEYKEIRKLKNRNKSLNRKKRNAKTEERKKELEQEIYNTEKKIIDIRQDKKLEEEREAIKCIRKNPKMIHSMISKKKNRKQKTIGPFKENNMIITDGQKITNILKNEYKSQFSEITETDENEIDIFKNIKEDDLNDIDITKEDVMKAIECLDENSAAGPDGVPAILLLKTKNEIAEPLRIILRKSIDETEIANIMKIAYITPIHKGGSRQEPGQYRPVSLTSHIMKLFERIIQKKIIEHLKNYKLFNEGQHGFVPGRSTMSQLVSHYNDIFEATAEGTRIDTVFLDFAKAFDKVDHGILLRKIKEHGIGGKIGKWIREFLKNRKFRVVASGYMSEEEDVESGVPQGTVLAAILFVIMISDIDKEINKRYRDQNNQEENSEEIIEKPQDDSEKNKGKKTNTTRVRSFADDTRVNKKIRDERDMEEMQRDLEIIYEWAKRNKMVFNEKKIEQMTHGKTEVRINEKTKRLVEVKSYKTTNGENIEIKENVKDLGVLASSDLKFEEHIEKIVTMGKIAMSEIMTTFMIREMESMLLIYKTYVRSKMEYGNIIWSPNEFKSIDKIEKVQQAFTKQIKGLENLDYYERLRRCGLFSMERRRERYLIIYGWQQLEGIKENQMNLRESEVGRTRRIQLPDVPYNGINGLRILPSAKTKLANSPARRTMALFNCLPVNLREIRGKSTNYFKLKLDEWIKKIPDQPKCKGYEARTQADTNSIVDQIRYIEIHDNLTHIVDQEIGDTSTER